MQLNGERVSRLGIAGGAFVAGGMFVDFLATYSFGDVIYGEYRLFHLVLLPLIFAMVVASVFRLIFKSTAPPQG